VHFAVFRSPLAVPAASYFNHRKEAEPKSAKGLLGEVMEQL